MIVKPYTATDNADITYTDYNNNFDTLYNLVNGNISDANINSAAAIVESKVAFSGSGHGHTGGTDGKLITISRGFGFFLPGTAAVANDLSWNPKADNAMTAVRLEAHVKTAPTGADLVVQIYNVTQSQVIATVTISATSTDAVGTSMSHPAIAQDDVLRADITQIGSTIAGADISLVLSCTQP